LIRSEKKRITSPQVGDADQTAQEAGNVACAVDLYQAIADKPVNLFFSLHSISVAVAMPYAGDKGDTRNSCGLMIEMDPTDWTEEFGC
jgi:serine protease inhibitor